jgi:hypothetical protein
VTRAGESRLAPIAAPTFEPHIDRHAPCGAPIGDSKMKNGIRCLLIAGVFAAPLTLSTSALAAGDKMDKADTESGGGMGGAGGSASKKKSGKKKKGDTGTAGTSGAM